MSRTYRRKGEKAPFNLEFVRSLGGNLTLVETDPTKKDEARFHSDAGYSYCHNNPGKSWKKRTTRKHRSVLRGMLHRAVKNDTLDEEALNFKRLKDDKDWW